MTPEQAIKQIREGFEALGFECLDVSPPDIGHGFKAPAEHGWFRIKLRKTMDRIVAEIDMVKDESDWAAGHIDEGKVWIGISTLVPKPSPDTA